MQQVIQLLLHRSYGPAKIQMCLLYNSRKYSVRISSLKERTYGSELVTTRSAEVNKLACGGASLQVTNFKLTFTPVSRLLSEEVIIGTTSFTKLCRSYVAASCTGDSPAIDTRRSVKTARELSFVQV